MWSINYQSTVYYQAIENQKLIEWVFFTEQETIAFIKILQI